MGHIQNPTATCNSTTSLADLQAQLDAFYGDPEAAVRAGTGADAMPLESGQLPEYADIVEWLRAKRWATARRPVPAFGAGAKHEPIDQRSIELLRLVRQAIDSRSPTLARLVVHMVTPGFYDPAFLDAASPDQLLEMLEAAVEILILRAEESAKPVLQGQSTAPILAAPVVDRRREIRQSRPSFSTTGPPSHPAKIEFEGVTVKRRGRAFFVPGGRR